VQSVLQSRELLRSPQGRHQVAVLSCVKKAFNHQDKICNVVHYIKLFSKQWMESLSLRPVGHIF
jgi:hypothetical protein